MQQAYFSLFNGIAKSSGAILEGHFELSSGKHTDKYLQCAKLNPNQVSSISNVLAAEFANLSFDLVVSPALGAILFGYEIAKFYNKKFVWVERVNGILTLRRGFEVNKGDRCLIIEDVVTTGKSTLETEEVILKSGGVVAGYGAIVDRSDSFLKFPLKSLVKYEFKHFDSSDCDLCKKGVGLQKLGSRGL